MFDSFRRFVGTLFFLISVRLDAKDEIWTLFVNDYARETPTKFLLRNKASNKGGVDDTNKTRVFSLGWFGVLLLLVVSL